MLFYHLKHVTIIWKTENYSTLVDEETEVQRVEVAKPSCKEEVDLHSAAAAAAKSIQSCPTLCDPIDGSPPGSTLPGTLQARTLEWGAISFSHSLH